ncbi:translation initiation factor IF-2-like [Phyllostomus hastatus]|uniref:translation initiation factor IF-2-like n=1 Tax=Phyllostomus hastatus TaxID=9423 RepID=UPI001E67FB2F|nr:translation initiation factor IF-2-like [Phyllostomus hastatus]
MLPLRFWGHFENHCKRWSSGGGETEGKSGRVLGRPLPGTSLPAPGAFPAAATILTGSHGGSRRPALPGPAPGSILPPTGLGCDAARRCQGSVPGPVGLPGGWRLDVRVSGPRLPGGRAVRWDGRGGRPGGQEAGSPVGQFSVASVCPEE